MDHVSNVDFLRVIDNLVHTLDNMNSRYYDNLHSIRNNTYRRRSNNMLSRTGPINLSRTGPINLSRPFRPFVPFRNTPVLPPIGTHFNRPFNRPFNRHINRPINRPINIPINRHFNIPINIPTNDTMNSFINNTLYTPSRPNYPTYTEIINSTTSSTFGDTLNTHDQETCVISREAFENSTEILRINHCGHIFKKESLLSWFDTSSICPICRHNIRIDLSNNTQNTIAPTVDNVDLSNNSLPEQNPFSQILDNISNVVINNLTNSVEQVLNTRIDLSNNPVSQFEYTFTMPNSNMTLR
jgi:hypothetical protein